MDSFMFPALVRFQLICTGEFFDMCNDSQCNVLSVCLACDQFFVVRFAFKLQPHYATDEFRYLYTSHSRTFVFPYFPFPSQILPVRCLVSCLKHQYHLHSVLPCIKLFSVFHQHQSGDHIFFLSGVSDYARQNRENACSALLILLFLRDSPRYIGVARKMIQFYKQQNVTVIHVERNNRRSDEP